MCDKLVFDLAQEVEGTPNVFVRKDWINILDNQNQNYSNNQSIIDTSQLSNSNKYMSYRESYIAVPVTITVGQTAISNTTLRVGVAGADLPAVGFNPTTPLVSADSCVGLKNWAGNLIHSMTLDYNGTTIVQQTPYVNMWNSFRLLTSLSLQDVKSQGATIGFYPDDSTAWGFMAAGAGSVDGTITMTTSGDSLFGDGVCNNTNAIGLITTAKSFYNFNTLNGNEGFIKRQSLICFDTDAITSQAVITLSTAAAPAPLITSVTSYPSGSGAPYSLLITSTSVQQIWKSYISQKVAAVVVPTVATGSYAITAAGFIQYAAVVTIYLKHIHSFFNMCPLLKGVFMKLTLNLNNVSTTFVTTSAGLVAAANAAGAIIPTGLHVSSVSNAIGGVNPLMIASADPEGGSRGLTFSYAQAALANGGTTTIVAGTIKSTYIANISVGAICLDNTLANANGTIRTASGLLAKSIYLYVPSYTFNPVFEQAYLSSPVKQIKYTDIYQYQVINVSGGQVFNNLITNGIANIKSVLLIPFYSSSGIPTPVPAGGATSINNRTGLTLSANTGLPTGMSPWSSPFDPAGCGCTSPLIPLTNFNVQISGQNAIYNLQKYNFEEFNNQLYGQNAVNGGLTDGLTSGLIDRSDFDMEYCYYYVNVERMLPVEMSVPKSVQIIGTNLSTRALDMYVFIEYGVEISIDSLSGARV